MAGAGNAGRAVHVDADIAAHHPVMMRPMRWTDRPTVVYRLARGLCRIVARVLFDVRLVGRENVPAPGSIVAGAPHRNWVEPFLLFAMLPAHPREVAIADAATIGRSSWRRGLISALGGAIPVGERAEPSAFRDVVLSTRGAIDAGAVVTIFPEAGPPSRQPELRPLSRGVAHLAAHAQAPVVPVVFGGTGELYLRRGIVMRLLPPLAPPPPNADRAAINAFMAELGGRCTVAAVEAHESAQSHVPRRKLWRWLSGRYPAAR